MKLLAPIEKQKRIEVVDALRGLALLGILLANVPNADAAVNNSAQDKSDYAVNFLFHLLIDKKFITIFSILFGFGFYIQLKRAEEAGIRFSSYYFKRMLILLLIGCIHAYIFWFGDIIRNYAICGMFLLLVYKWSSKKLLITAIIFSVFLTGSIFIVNGIVGINYSYDTSIVQQLYLTDSYWRYLWINARIDSFVNFLQDSPITMVFCFGNMIIGFLMARSGFFDQLPKFISLRRKLIVSGLTLGIAASYAFWLVTNGRIELNPALLWLPYIIVAGMLLQSLFYISAFVNLFQTQWAKNILSVFIPVGKMSLSNYLLQTVFYLLVFFHWTYGFRLFGKIGLTETYLIAILFFALQVIISRMWLKYHTQGPIESLWKNLSYKLSNE